MDFQQKLHNSAILVYFYCKIIWKLLKKNSKQPKKIVQLFIRSVKKKACESGFPYCFLTDFTKFILRENMLLDFGFLTEESS